MEYKETIYVYCHVCKKLLFKGELKAAVEFSTDMECWKIHKHVHTVGSLWYFNNANPEIDTKGWEQWQMED